MDRLVTLGHERRAAPARLLAGTWHRVPADWRGRSAVAIGLTLWVVTGWLLVAGAVALMLPPVATSAPKDGLIVEPGRTARIRQPGMPDWPIPVDRLAYEEYHRGYREADDDAMDHAFAAFEWIKVLDRQAVRIVEVDGDAVQIEVLEGPNIGRRGWLKPRHLGP
jgi:hypothetical protein